MADIEGSIQINETHTITADKLKPAPLIFVQDPYYLNETQTLPDPWCLSCGARVAPKGLPVHTRWHGWQPQNHEVLSHGELEDGDHA